MSQAPSTHNVAARRFFGQGADTGSPFDLLGVAARELPTDDIVEALEHRLAQLAVHPECRTPAADELRLALHAAAAQVLDPGVREQLILIWTHGGPGAAHVQARAGSQPKTASSRFASTIGLPPKLALEGDAVMAIAMSGGWNARSLERLCMFAHARGLTADDVADAITSLARPKGSQASQAPRHTGHSLPIGPARRKRAKFMGGAQAAPLGSGVHTPPDTASQPVPRSRLFELDEAEIKAQSARQIKIALAAAAALGALLFALAMGIIVMFKTNPKPPPMDPNAAITPGVEVARPVAPTTPDKKPTSKPTTPGSRGPSADDIQRELQACVARLKEDAGDAATRFEAVAAAARSDWIAWSADELAGVLNQIVEFMYRSSGDPGVTRRALSVLSAPLALGETEAPSADRIAPAVWSAGVLARLLNERDQRAAVLGPARLALGAAGVVLGEKEQDFNHGASVAALALAPRLAKDPSVESWTRWLAVTDALSQGDAPAKGRFVAVALEAILSLGPEPSAAKQTFDSVVLLASSLSWRVDENTRPWLMRWFDMSSLSSADINAVTFAIAARSSAQGVDPSMVLSATSGNADRAELRAKYAKAWSLSGAADRTEAAKKWSLLLADLLADKPPQEAAPSASSNTAATPIDVQPTTRLLMRAQVFSSMSEAAAAIFAGKSDRASAIIADVSAPAKAAAAKLVSKGSSALFAPENDGVWAAKYLASMANGPVRVEMLQQVLPAGALSPVEAEIVVTEALRGSPASVRILARDAAKRHGSEFAVVNAFLELVPTIPIVSDNADLLEIIARGRLPNLRAPTWRQAARRILVERLLELAAGKGEYAVIDELAALMGDSYKSRVLLADGSVTGATSANLIDAPALASLAQGFAAQWQREAEHLLPSGGEHATLASIRQRAAGRASLARGAVQEFAAAEFSACELMAYTLVAEAPARAETVRVIMVDFTASRRQASHLFEQIHAAERAMARLWALRLGGVEAAGGGGGGGDTQ
ncbi:MAG: hypothetical protein AABZ53_02220 [Planctomycetota bacterium]